MNWIKRKIRQLFFWIFRNELKELQHLIKQFNDVRANQLAMSKGMEADQKRFTNMLDNIDISVDHHYHSSSWAVISLQGNKSDYIKFVDLGDRDINEIAMFLSKYDRRKVDASPGMSAMLRFEADDIYPGKILRNGRR